MDGDSDSVHSQSVMGGGKQGRRTGDSQLGNDRVPTAATSVDNDNPFKIPSDELIFTFKEDEKARKIQEREQNKKLKLWEKNRPVREGCLRKLCETDIQPSGIAINSKVASKVNMNEFNSFTVPIERPKNQETRYQLKEKKRQIFLAQQLNETKYAEIERLANHNEMRQMGLLCSEKMLESDTKSFLEFFASIKKQTNQAAADLEALKKQKNDAQTELRAISDECGTIQSQINKNLEVLDRLLGFKEFLDELTPAQIKEQQEERRLARQAQKQHLEDQRRAVERSKYRQTGQQDAEVEQKMDVDDSLRIQDKLKRVLEDSEDEYNPPFTHAQDLMALKDDLEERNLFLITQGQENQKQYEDKTSEYNIVKSKAESEFSALENREREMQNRIEKTLRERENLQADTIEDNTKIIKPEKYNELWQRAKTILKMFQGKQDVKNTDPVPMLLEIEHKIEFADAFICKHFKESEELFKETLIGVKRTIKDQKAKQDSEDQKKEEERTNAIKRNKGKDRVVVKDKHPEMFISEKKAVKRQEVKQVAYTQGQLDMKYYGGEALFHQLMAAGKLNNL